jgi:hypothetical protein
MRALYGSSLFGRTATADGNVVGVDGVTCLYRKNQRGDQNRWRKRRQKLASVVEVAAVVAAASVLVNKVGSLNNSR